MLFITSISARAVDDIQERLAALVSANVLQQDRRGRAWLGHGVIVFLLQIVPVDVGIFFPDNDLRSAWFLMGTCSVCKLSR